jgi:hypothetical protein
MEQGVETGDGDGGSTSKPQKQGVPVGAPSEEPRKVLMRAGESVRIERFFRERSEE